MDPPINIGRTSRVGFDYEFLPPLEDKYECLICLLGLRTPMQTSCGHHFCRDCINLHLREIGKKCPVDNTPITEQDLFLDSCVEREILQRKVICPNNKLGCKYQGDLKYIENHTQACDFQPVMCPNDCSSTVLQRELENHIVDQCIARITRCLLCDQTHKFKDEQVHQLHCSQISVPCEICMHMMPRGDLQNHMTDMCPKAVIPCPFAEHGCTQKIKRELLQQHMVQATSSHLSALSSVVKRVNTLVTDLGRSVGFSGSFSRQPSLRSQVSISPITEVPHINQERNDHSMYASPEHTNYKEASVDKCLYLPLSNLNVSQDEDLKAQKNVPSVTFSERVLQDLSEKSLDLDQRTVEQSIQINGLAQKVTSLHKNMERLAVEISGLFSYGEFLWRIRDFNRICKEMCDNSEHTIFSNPFFNKPLEYRFCIRFNITKDADDEYFITLNIHIMKGDNDHMLDWPFNGHFSLSIMDCGMQYPKKHIISLMNTKPNISAFERPTTPRNSNGFGFTKFALLRDIQCSNSYVKNDTLCIKATVASHQFEVSNNTEL